MKHLYLIGGPMGVGKTAACRALQSRLDRSVFLDGDWCWGMRPFQVTEETKPMVMDNICCVLNNFLHCSAYDHVIFCWVLYRQALLDDLRSRLAGDIRAGRRTPDVTERSLRRLPLYAALDTQKIDVSPLPPEETAAEIVREAGR